MNVKGEENEVEIGRDSKGRREKGDEGIAGLWEDKN